LTSGYRRPLRDFQGLLFSGNPELRVVLRDRLQPRNGRFPQITRAGLRNPELDSVTEDSLSVQLATLPPLMLRT
jgi:hypothetical protein